MYWLIGMGVVVVLALLGAWYEIKHAPEMPPWMDELDQKLKRHGK